MPQIGTSIDRSLILPGLTARPPNVPLYRNTLAFPVSLDRGINQLRRDVVTPNGVQGRIGYNGFGNDAFWALPGELQR